MTHSPRRRPLTLDGVMLELEDFIADMRKTAPEIALGWSALKAELRQSGWPARTPEDDQADRDRAKYDHDHERVEDDPDALDYADPTGDLAGQLWDNHADLETLQDHLHTVFTEYRALKLIAARHRPPATPAVPVCSYMGCTEAVETMPRGGYRGMRQIAGVWVTNPGSQARCAGHRRVKGS